MVWDGKTGWNWRYVGLKVGLDARPWGGGRKGLSECEKLEKSGRGEAERKRVVFGRKIIGVVGLGTPRIRKNTVL